MANAAAEERRPQYTTPQRPLPIKFSTGSSLSSGSSTLSSIFDRDKSNTSSPSPLPSSPSTPESPFQNELRFIPYIPDPESHRFRRSSSTSSKQSEEQESPVRRQRGPSLLSILSISDISTISQRQTSRSGVSRRSNPTLNRRRSSNYSTNKSQDIGKKFSEKDEGGEIDGPVEGDGDLEQPTSDEESSTGSSKSILVSDNSSSKSQSKMRDEEMILSDTHSLPKLRSPKRPTFRQYGKSKSVERCNADIYKYISDKSKKSRRTSLMQNELGYVYVFHSPSHAPDHVKIGITKSDPSRRLENIERDCKFEVKQLKDKHKDAFQHYQVVETLTHLSLHHARKEFDCLGCKNRSTHQEWFKLSSEIAFQEVSMWRSWILKHRPFDDEGRLTDYWEWRTRKLKAILSKVKWEEWTQPSMFDYVDFRLEQWQKEYWIRLKIHLSRKDLWFLQMGTIFSLLISLKFGWSGFICAVIALLIL